MDYVGRGQVRVLLSTPHVLAARVQGGERYLTVLERNSTDMYYGCSCPFFADREVPCKHLYALALEASGSAMVRGAASCRVYRPDAAILEPFEPDDEDDFDEDDFDDDDDLDGFAAAHGVRLPPRPQSWKELVQRVATHSGPRVDAKVELLYFLLPGVQHQATRVVVGERRIGAPANAFRLVQAPALESLAHPLDRELCALLLAARMPTSDYFNGPNPLGMEISPFAAPAVLEQLQRSGRCRVVPARLESERPLEWSLLSGRRVVSSGAPESEGAELGKLLEWPLLTRHEGEPFQLAVALVPAAGHSRKPGKRSLEVRGELFRGDERRPVSEVRSVQRDGTVLLGSELHPLEASDAGWLAALASQWAPVHVPENELSEFVEKAFGRSGASGLSLPADYERVQTPAMRPVLELEAPRGKKIQGLVAFEYSKRRVPAVQQAPLVIVAGQVFERAEEAERSALELLKRAGFVGELLENAPTPQGCLVTIDEKSLAPALREVLAAGFLVEAEGKRYRAASGFDIEVESGIDWFEVKGNVKFDGGDVPFPALLAAIKQRKTMVRLSDGSFGVLAEEWMQRWGLMAELAPEKTGRLRFSSRQLGLMQALLAALPEDGAGARGLQALRERLDKFQAIEAKQPERGFRGALRPYQELGLGFLSALGELGFGVCLADDMGLGKTIQVLAYLWEQRKRAKGSKPTLVVVPRSLLSNWLDEAARFAPKLAMYQHWGSERARTKAALEQADVVLTTYGTLRLDAALLREIEFGCVVLDEAQAIKNKNSATAKCAKLLRAERRVAMSGTPVENHLGELWSLFEFLNPGLLGELQGLRRALESSKPSPEVLSLVRTLVRPFVLRRTKGQVAKDLPERVEQTLYVDLEQDERKLYDGLFRHYQASIAKKVSEVGVDRATPHLLEALLRLRQAACHAGLIDDTRRHEGSAKLECLVDRLRALRDEGHRALVFSQFTSLLSIVRERLAQEQITFEYLDGKTQDRAACVARFQSDPSLDVFLISLKAGGVGLNLTAADYVFILDPWWNPAAEAQAIDRAHRIGQTRNVIAYRLLARGTVEERVAQLQAQKRDLVAGIMGDDDSLSARLTRGDLGALLSLASTPLDGVGRTSAPN